MRKLVVLTLVASITALTAVSVGSATHIIRPSAATQVATRPTVRILRVHPNPNTGCISAEIRIRGWKMLPSQVGLPVNVRGAGHYHVYINGKYYTVGANAYHARACGLAGGSTYKFQVILAFNNHQELSGRSQVVTAVL